MNSQPPQVAGLSLSGDVPYTITAEEDRRVCRLSGAEPAADGTAHPVFFYIATQVGMGMTVAGLCASPNWIISASLCVSTPGGCLGCLAPGLEYRN